MQAWEYRVVAFTTPGNFEATVLDSGLESGSTSVRSATHLSIAVLMGAYINRLGLEGWELVGVAKEAYTVCIFKRPAGEAGQPHEKVGQPVETGLETKAEVAVGEESPFKSLLDDQVKNWNKLLGL